MKTLTKILGMSALALTLGLTGCSGKKRDWDSPQVAREVIKNCGTPVMCYKSGYMERTTAIDIDDDGIVDGVSSMGKDFFYRPGFKELVNSRGVHYILDSEAIEMSPGTAEKLQMLKKLSNEVTFELYQAKLKQSKTNETQ